MEAARREPPAIPSDLPRLVTRIQLVVRSLDSLRVKASMLPVGSEDGATWRLLSQPVAFRPAVGGPISAGRTWKYQLTPTRPFAVRLVCSRRDCRPGLNLLSGNGLVCGPYAALSVRAPTLTGKPSRALEQVELFPLRFFFPDARPPHDGRPGTLRCSGVPCPDTLTEADPAAAGSHQTVVNPC
mgnify:CR=1 FL=1